MKRRRWFPGRQVELKSRYQSHGVEVRALRGKKAPDDLVLELRTNRGWVRVPHSLVFACVDFFTENEDALYPPPRFKGGRMILDYCKKRGTARLREGPRRRLRWSESSPGMRSGCAEPSDVPREGQPKAIPDDVLFAKCHGCDGEMIMTQMGDG